MATALYVLALVLIVMGGCCANVFLELFRTEISDYIKACADAKREKQKHFNIMEKALKQWEKDHDNAD